MELKNSIALVTGGASGLGQATVEEFVSKGAKVVILDINEDNAIPSATNDIGTVEGIEEKINLKRIFSEPPYYPRKALRLGDEGYVHIQFDIAKDGTVLDPYVIESRPPGVFERAAIKAVRKWVYEAPIFNGQNVNIKNVKVTLGFNLE